MLIRMLPYLTSDYHNSSRILRGTIFEDSQLHNSFIVEIATYLTKPQLHIQIYYILAQILISGNRRPSLEQKFLESLIHTPLMCHGPFKIACGNFCRWQILAKLGAWHSSHPQFTRAVRRSLHTKRDEVQRANVWVHCDPYHVPSHHKHDSSSKQAGNSVGSRWWTRGV